MKTDIDHVESVHPSEEHVELMNQPEAEAPVSAGLWRRLGAAWVDLFLLYAAASLLIEGTGLLRVRLALEPTLLALGIVYGVACLHQGGRTLGKLLFGIAVAAPSSTRLSWERIFVREAVGKWFILGAVPGIVGRLLLSTAWVPTAYDLLAVIPLILATVVHYAFCRRTWYDQLAGTAVIRRPASGWMPRRAFAVLLGVAVLGAGVKVMDQVWLSRFPSRTLLYYGMGSSQPYVDFLKQTVVLPKDYIFGLFERYDVVVLCERAHPEVTQWDFIFDLVSDPRFSQKVGHVFTELGQTGMQPYLDTFMATDGLSNQEVDERVLHIMRNWSVWPTWNRVNFPTYLKRLYALNQSLPAEQRIQHHFTDIAVDWPNLTREKIPDHWRALWNRDEKMAQVVIAGMERLDEAGANRPRASW